MKGDKDMNYKTMRNQIEDMVNDNHKDFIKAIISMEKGINDESALDKLYDAHMDNDSLNLLHEEFDYMIEDLRTCLMLRKKRIILSILSEILLERSM